MLGVDIAIVLFTEFKDLRTGFYCRQPGKIAANYLRTTFFIDFLAFFPFFDVISSFGESHEGDEETYDFLHLLYLLRLLRLYKAAQLLKPNYVFGGIKKLHRYVTNRMY